MAVTEMKARVQLKLQQTERRTWRVQVLAYERVCCGYLPLSKRIKSKDAAVAAANAFYKGINVEVEWEQA